MEPSEVLKVTVSVISIWGAGESFFAKMYKSGRIRIPNLTIALLKHEKPNLEGYAIKVTLEPT